MISAALDSVLLTAARSTLSRFHPQADGHEGDEDGKHALQGGARHMLRQLGADPRAEEEAECNQ